MVRAWGTVILGTLAATMVVTAQAAPAAPQEGP